MHTVHTPVINLILDFYIMVVYNKLVDKYLHTIVMDSRWNAGLCLLTDYVYRVDHAALIFQRSGFYEKTWLSEGA